MDPRGSLDLWSILYDQNTQFHVIRTGMTDLRKADSIEQRDWLGNPMPDLVSTGTKRRKPVSNTLPDVLSQVTETTTAPLGGDIHFGQVVDEAESLIAASSTRHLSTWFVLFFLLSSDTLRDMVRRGTQPAIADAYFETFETRMSCYISGRISYEPRSKEARAKSGKLLQSAVSPAEAVVLEWNHLQEIVRRVHQG